MYEESLRGSRGAQTAGREDGLAFADGKIRAVVSDDCK